MAESSGRSANLLRLRFAIGFIVVAGALFSVYTFPYEESGISERWFAAYLSLYARLAGGILSQFDPTLTVSGQDILGRFNLRIVKNCDAMEANILFAAAVLAFPGAWGKRLVGVFFGVPVLVAINVLRICSLYYVGIHLPGAFEFFHLELWPLVMTASAVIVFLVWATWGEGRAAGASHAAP